MIKDDVNLLKELCDRNDVSYTLVKILFAREREFTRRVLNG